MEKAGLPQRHPRFSTFARTYRALYGLPPHLGQHSGGMIISQENLDAVVPLENATMPGRVVAQWDQDNCEDLGIIKVDLLGLGMMSVLQDAIELTHRRGHGVNLETIPKDDAATFNMMQKADTIGVFQISFASNGFAGRIISRLSFTLGSKLQNADARSVVDCKLR